MARRRRVANKKDKGAPKAPRVGAGDPRERTEAEADVGDLRAVERHVAAFIAGDLEGQKALLMLGRDAAGLLMKLAEQHQNEELKTFAKRLVAVTPQVKTNLFDLRELSVMAILKDALGGSAKNAANTGEISVEGNQVALFDPVKVRDTLVKGGRPRKEPARIAAGDLAWFGIEHPGPVRATIATSPPPEGQAVLTLRLVVESGVVFVGPPGAADGPRLGEVRLDPFRTGLDDFLGRGRLVRVKPGRYRVSAHQAVPPEIRIFLEVDTADAGPIPVELTSLGRLPPLRGE